MTNITKIDMAALKNEENEIVRFYKKNLTLLSQLVSKVKKVQWSDANNDRFVEEMNMAISLLLDSISKLTNGSEVYIISDLIEEANEYLKTELKYFDV